MVEVKMCNIQVHNCEEVDPEASMNDWNSDFVMCYLLNQDSNF